ncbi:MAG: hypothetical protein R3Y63_15610 [Eubacteriales bacterium]
MDYSIYSSFNEWDGFVKHLHNLVGIGNEYALFHLARFYPQECSKYFDQDALDHFAKNNGLERYASMQHEDLYLLEVIELADKGDKLALYTLGRYYYDYFQDKDYHAMEYQLTPESEFSTTKNNDKAIDYFLMSAEQGFPEAHLYLSKIFRDGHGVEADPDESFRWCVDAAGYGSLEAVCTLACYHHFGYGTKQNNARAKEILEVEIESLSEYPTQLAVLYKKHFEHLSLFMSS